MRPALSPPGNGNEALDRWRRKNLYSEVHRLTCCFWETFLKHARFAYAEKRAHRKRLHGNTACKWSRTYLPISY